MPSPTDTPPASDAPLLAASIAPGPPPVMTAKPASASAAPELDRPVCVVGVARPACGPLPNTRDRRAELGQRAEALDELRLDPQHPPRVGVHPVGRPARVEQPLVGGRRRGTCARRMSTGPRAGARAAVLGLHRRLLGRHAGQASQRRHPLRHSAAGARAAPARPGCAPARVARPEVDRRHAERAENCDTSVQPNFGSRLAAHRLDERGSRRTVETGQRARRLVAHLQVEAGEDLAQVRLRLVDAAVGREPVVDARPCTRRACTLPATPPSIATAFRPSW